MLQWDTQFWGFNIAHVLGPSLTPQRAKEVERWCKVHLIRCLYFLVPSNAANTAEAAEDAGFRLTDVRHTLNRSILHTDSQFAPPLRGVILRKFEPRDLHTLEAIARTSYTDTRFYYDHNFPRALCEALYIVWIRSSCEDLAQQVLVADMSDQPVGYIACQLDESGAVGRIGLIGVHANARGHGIGRALVAAALHWFRSHGAREVFVVTQARNIAAQRLYQEALFKTSMMQLWFHKWYVSNV